MKTANLLIQKTFNYGRLMRLHRPIGTLLLLWPMLWALWIASQGAPNLKVLGIFLCGVFLMRAAGCVINDISDRDFDPLVERTKLRPLAAGTVSVREAWLIFAILSGLALLDVLYTNRLTILHSGVALLLAAVYPLSKRWCKIPQLVLGLAFSYSIPMVFAAQLGYIPSIAWKLYAITILWVISYDTWYAMADREDDLKIGVKSSAIWFGPADLWIIAGLQLGFLLALYSLKLEINLGTSFTLSLFGAGSLFAYQLFIARDRSPEVCLRAFNNNNWVGLLIFLGLLVNY